MSPAFDETLERVLSLDLSERNQLGRLILASLQREMEPKKFASFADHWGEDLNRLLDLLGPFELVDPEITDPVEWVKTQRAKDAQKRAAFWDLKE